MTDFTVRSESVDVEQIMRQIRTRIREKRGADYTEAELQQLASVTLDKFLDPRGVRSDLVQQFRRQHVAVEMPPNYEFEADTLYKSHRVPFLYRLRRLLNPILKLFINPDPITHALHLQSQANSQLYRRFGQRAETDSLIYELVHNMVVEITRLGIETQNLKMRVESLTSRLDFDERRARALEQVVEYRPPSASRPGGAAAPAGAGSGTPAGPGSEGTSERRRRRRRRRRRPGQTLADTTAAAAAGGAPPDSGAPAEAGPEDAPGSPDPQGPLDDDGGPEDAGADDQ